MNFDDDPERISIFNEWIKKRNLWRTIEFPKKQGLDLYNNLFKLYSEIKKESERVELILGDGMIKWETEKYTIEHPVFLQKVKLEFDPDEPPSFIIKFEEPRIELYDSMLRIVESIDPSMLSEMMNEIEKNIYYITDEANMIGIFARLINVVDKSGKYVENFNNDNYDGPIIYRNPVLFLRKRTLGYSEFIRKIIKKMENSDESDIDIAGIFEGIIGTGNSNDSKVINGNNWNYNGIDEDVLLTLPANNDQLKLVQYLNNYSTVLVQGPPGTGKTHTIANLIGYLLSEGKNILVTSHTEKALAVLKEKVCKDLQSLCVSLLSSRSQRNELESSLFEISEKITSLDLEETKSKIKKLIEERKQIIEEYKIKNEEIIKIRSLEYKYIVFNNKTMKPIDVAKYIYEGKGKIDYIPGKTRDNTIGLPLSIEELYELYESNEKISIEEENILSKQIPDIGEIWDGNKLILNKKELKNLKEELYKWEPEIILKNEITEIEIKELLEILYNIDHELNSITKFQYALINKTIKDNAYKILWDEILSKLDMLLDRYIEWRKICFEDAINIPAELKNYETVEILNKIIKTNKGVPVNSINSILKPKWRELKKRIKIKNKSIIKLSEYEKANFVIQYELNKDEIIRKINKLFNEISEETIFESTDFEEKIKQDEEKIKFALNWYNHSWSQLIQELSKYMKDPKLSYCLLPIDSSDPIGGFSKKLKCIIADIEKYSKNFRYQRLQFEWTNYVNFINKYQHLSSPFSDLNIALENEKSEDYERNYELLKNIYIKKKVHELRRNIIEKLKFEAPDWAKDIHERRGVHGEKKLPNRIKDAWEWRQLYNQLEKLNSYNPNNIEKYINQLNEKLINNAKNLAYEKAWYEKIKNTSSTQMKAIKAWSQTIKQIGKGTGKSAPRLNQKARELMSSCQLAIPVWIMPLSKVVEMFDPIKNKFDVIIIDEASQANILALSVLYMGEKVIIVGDNEQVSPDSIGIGDNEINALIEQYLDGIPNNHLYNSKTSVYDIAGILGFQPLMLTEHYRCLPEIIEFSNQISYNGKIKPLRDASGVTTTPAVVEYRVPDGIRINKVNKKEAEHIASLVCACIENKKYSNKTIGVISMLGEPQAYEIDRLLQIHLDPREYEKRKIQCGVSAQFQGDERDIIFISIVDTPKANNAPVRLVSEEGGNDMYKKRYNVAASRAKDQMWIVHSLNPEIDLKPDDIRLKLIKHAMNPNINKYRAKLEEAESDFEKAVMKTLLNKGYKLIPQWKVGSYRIDMVVEDGKCRVAVECDGEKYHTCDNLKHDLERQAILQRLGWRFIRIRGSEYYKDPDKTIDWVCHELEDYNIRPNFSEQEDCYNTINGMEFSNGNNNDLIEDLKRRANEIRNEWQTENDNINYIVNDSVIGKFNESYKDKENAEDFQEYIDMNSQVLLKK